MTESLNDILKVKVLRVCSIWNEKLNTCLFSKVLFIFSDKTNVDELTALKRSISQISSHGKNWQMSLPSCFSCRQFLIIDGPFKLNLRYLLVFSECGNSRLRKRRDNLYAKKVRNEHRAR